MRLRWFCILFVIVPFVLYAQRRPGGSEPSSGGSSSSVPSPSPSPSGSYGGGGSSGGGSSHSGGGSYSGAGSSGGSHDGGGSYSGGSSASSGSHHGGSSGGSPSGGPSTPSGSHNNSGTPSNNHRNSGSGNSATDSGAVGSKQDGSLNSGARVSNERFTAPDVGRDASQSSPAVPATNVWNGVQTSSHHEYSQRQSQLDSYRPKQDWLVGSQKPVDRHALSKYFSRQEQLDDREAKLNREAAQLKADRLKSGARISKLDFKEQKLAAKRARLEGDRKKAGEALADANKRKPCKQKNCVQCPGGVMSKKGCVYPPQQEANLYLCYSEYHGLAYQQVPCSTYYRYHAIRGNQCDSLHRELEREENYIKRLFQEVVAACSPDSSAPDCVMLKNQLEQARVRLENLEQQYRICMMWP